MRVLLGTSLLISMIAVFDAARGNHWDQVAMLLFLGGLAVVGLMMTASSADAVRPRADLMTWVKRQAAITDDEPRLVIDRAIAAYRAQLLPDAEDQSP